jgi:hypothetical protein
MIEIVLRVALGIVLAGSALAKLTSRATASPPCRVMGSGRSASPDRLGDADRR